MLQIQQKNSKGEFRLQELIDYLKKTPEEDWITNVCRRGNRNCLMGHIFEFGGGETKSEGEQRNNGSFACDFFEAFYATTYMFYPVNDGLHPRYKQKSAKERCIAYLENMRDGKEKTSIQLFEEYDKIMSNES